MNRYQTLLALLVSIVALVALVLLWRWNNPPPGPTVPVLLERAGWRT